MDNSLLRMDNGQYWKFELIFDKKFIQSIYPICPPTHITTQKRNEIFNIEHYLEIRYERMYTRCIQTVKIIVKPYRQWNF